MNIAQAVPSASGVQFQTKPILELIFLVFDHFEEVVD